jgi:Ca-activated chloride channel family protein
MEKIMIRRRIPVIIGVIAFVFSVMPQHARAALPADRELGGTLTATVDGRQIHFPALKTDITADIQGDLATVTVIQTFSNPTAIPLNATYLFPLNKDAAVYAMQMEVGDEIVSATIMKKEEAKQTFAAAKSEGKAAALLTQHRPNMFTQDIANLMPGLPVKVTLQYTQAAPRIDGAYELVVPLIVGPRYNPDAPGAQVAGDNVVPSGQWRVDALPAYPEVAGLTIPDTIGRDRVSIRVNLVSGLDIKAVASATHAVDIDGTKTAKTVTLADGRTIDNKDFVLRYRLAGRMAEAGFLAHRDERGGFFSLLIEPPEAPEAKDITPREMVFVLDTSGSMSGMPIAASKTFMSHALKNLRRDDYFRIIRFGSNASEFASQPVPATETNIRSGLAFVNSLSPGGGTEIPKAIHKAFAMPQAPGTMRIVVFLSDGYIGNEAEVLRQISTVIGEARIYAFGVGTSVNRYLLAEMARKGRGFARFVDPTEDGHVSAIAMAGKLETPVLTDIEIDWGKLAAGQISPTVIPDLFAGESIRVQGMFSGTGRQTVTVRGLVNGRRAELPVTVDLPGAEGTPESAGIPLIWARSKIADHMRVMTTHPNLRNPSRSNAAIEKDVTELGLSFSLATRWTSFVAVSKKVVNSEPGLSKSANVPLPMVEGVTESAYGTQQVSLPTQTAGNFSGGSAPEPGVLGGLAVLTLAGLFAARWRRRS